MFCSSTTAHPFINPSQAGCSTLFRAQREAARGDIRTFHFPVFTKKAPSLSGTALLKRLNAAHGRSSPPD